MKFSMNLVVLFLMFGPLEANTIVVTNYSEKKAVVGPKITFLMKLFSVKKEGFNLTFTDSPLLHKHSLFTRSNITKSALYAKINYRF